MIRNKREESGERREKERRTYLAPPKLVSTSRKGLSLRVTHFIAVIPVLFGVQYRLP